MVDGRRALMAYGVLQDCMGCRGGGVHRKRYPNVTATKREPHDHDVIPLERKDNRPFAPQLSPKHG